MRRAERRLGKAEGAGWLAHWVIAAVELQQTRTRPIRRADGAGWSIDVHERDLSLVRSTESLQQMQCRIAAVEIKQLLLDATNLEPMREEQLQAGVRGTVCGDAAIVPRIVVGRAICADSVQDLGSESYPAAAAGCS